MRIVITGTPSAGKSFLAKKLARELALNLIDVNKLVRKKNLFSNKRLHEVDLSKLRRELARRVEKEKNYVIEGHLACEFSIPCDLVVVLRCNPLELMKRMKEKNYGEEKIRDNLLCEVLDYCLVKAELNYGKNNVIQIDNTRFASLKKILSKIKLEKSDRVDWSLMILKNPGLRGFLEQERRS